MRIRLGTAVVLMAIWTATIPCTPCPGQVSTSGENPASAAGFSAELEGKHVGLNRN